MSLAVASLPLFGQSELQKAAEEFKIQTRNLGLRGDGAGVKAAAKPVSSRWHGRIYENIRNDALDALPHQISQRGGDKAVLRRNQFGFNISGPFIIPKLYSDSHKTFFSFSYEGVRDHTARSQLQTLPTVPERTGNFAAVVDQSGAFLPIYDPASTWLNPNYDPSKPVTRDNVKYNRLPFAGNRIDPSRISSIALKSVEYYPAPNASAGPFDRNNYFLVTPQTNNHDGIILNVDHTIRVRHRISLNYNDTRGFNGSATMLPTAADPASPARTTRDPWGSVEYTFTKSPQTVNKLRLYLETYQSTAGEQGAPDYAGKLGLRGSSALAFPNFSISPYVTMGRSYPQSRYVSNYYTLNETLTHKRGQHSFSFQLNHSRYQYNNFESAYPAGSFRFDEGLTSLPGIVGTGHAFATFLLGLAGYAEKSYQVSPTYVRNWYTNLSGKDQFQAGKNLTLTFSLAVWASRPKTEKYNRLSTVDLSAINPANGRPGAMIVAGINGVGRSFQPTFWNVDPTLSIAWNLLGDSRTVLRSSVNYSHNSGGSSTTTQAFNAAPVYLSSNTQLEPAVRLENGLPPLTRPLPDLRPEALNDTNADLVYRGWTRPVYFSASLSIERQMPFSTVVTLGASDAGGRDMTTGNSSVNLNAIPLSALQFRDQLYDESFNKSLRPYPQYKSLNLGGYYPAGRYRQESAYISIEKRATAGLSMNFRYTWTNRRDDYSGNRQQYFNGRAEWGPSSYYTPGSISFSYIYELPVGRGKAFLRFSDWKRYIVDGWSLSGSTSYSKGYPLALRPQFNNTGGVIANLRVNVVPGVDPHVSDPGPSGWFNPAAFDQPADFTLGNGARSYWTLRGPASQNHDLSASKRFPLGGEKTLEFNAVALNFLNHANWNSPDVVIGPRSAPNVNAGKIIGSSGGRVMQLGLKVSF